MGVSPWKRVLRRTRRRLRHSWAAVNVTWRGNRVERNVDFGSPIEHPILLMQGFASSRRALRVLEKRLRAEGHEVMSVRMGGLFGTLNTRRIQKAAELVALKMAGWRERGQLGPFTVVAHSKGGLIARYMIACLEAGAHVDTVVTLGTPHCGLTRAQLWKISRLSWLMPSVRQMRRNSRFFRELVEGQVPAHIRCISIGSNGDRIVPERACTWEAPEARENDTIILDRVTHTDYLLKGRVYDALRPYLPHREV